MLDKEYSKAESIISNAKYQLEKIFDNGNYKGVENYEAYKELEHLIEKLDDTERHLQYLGKPTKEGRLVEDRGGKFFIAYDDGEESYLLSCGTSLEVYLKEDLEEDVEEGWHIGRVEHRSKNGQEGYYFYGANKPFLYEGMRARKRIER